MSSKETDSASASEERITSEEDNVASRLKSGILSADYYEDRWDPAELDPENPPAVPVLPLSSGFYMPAIGFGTYIPKPGGGPFDTLENMDTICEAVKSAIDIGYRHFDCAYMYKNEEGVGRGLKAKIDEGVVRRDQLFITTKVWSTHHRKERVFESVRESLRKLQTDYLDLCLIHWPMSFKEVDTELVPYKESGEIDQGEIYDIMNVWRSFEELVEEKLTRSIGLSNFNQLQISRILLRCNIQPAVNQIERHVFLQNMELSEYCLTRSIQVVAYSPLAASYRQDDVPRIHDHSLLVGLAEKYGRTPEQVALRFLIQLGTCPIPRALSVKHMKDNFEVFDFRLEDEDVEKIEGLGVEFRFCTVPAFQELKYYPFVDNSDDELDDFDTEDEETIQEAIEKFEV